MLKKADSWADNPSGSVHMGRDKEGDEFRRPYSDGENRSRSE
jgi:hypothetical protein